MNSEMQLVELLRRINKEISKRLVPIFREQKLSIVEISVLMRMNRRPACRASELATMIGIPSSTVTGILDRLERRGLIERRHDPNDRRSILITETQKTKDFVADLMTSMEDMLREAFRSMPDSRTQRLIEDLRFILEALEQQSSAAE
jgi:DNA-binding MarR family transcriptional regulator